MLSTDALNAQLASALSTMGGDAQYWEESISPQSIRDSLTQLDPNSSELLRPMKWLLASISKGRDVSDFYALVIKLVGARSLEIRKLVYAYLAQYADYDSTTRELSLLSVNALQRGLADREQWIRALALRVLTVIRLPDLVPIQILALQRCTRDESPYVRKCAANALPKIQADEEQKQVLMDMVQHLLDTDASTMVLTSAVTALAELEPESLNRLHSSYRKLCHLLTDMDEWGQVVVLDVLQRYCRKFFRKPRTQGKAERIDRQRRVRRTVHGLEQPTEDDSSSLIEIKGATSPIAAASISVAATTTLPPHPGSAIRKIKRKVIKKGFYSDEEDTSTEEEVYADPSTGEALPVSTAFREPVALHSHSFKDDYKPSMVPNMTTSSQTEDSELDPDHRLLLHSAMPLLKSRNAGVVMAVCSLLYYCGIASIPVRASMGKALVRIHRDKREIQYVVLASIRCLVKECPSAFGPFLHDFFIQAIDPPFTRVIKLDILTSLALDPPAVNTVLQELRTYIRGPDASFSCASIHAVGRVVETARIIYDRHGRQTQQIEKQRAVTNQIALNALFGLLTCTRTCTVKAVVSECVVVMQWILRLLWNDSDKGSLGVIEDPNRVQEQVLKRMLLLLVHVLSTRRTLEQEAENGSDDSDEDDSQPNKLAKLCLQLTPQAVAAAMWIMGETLTELNQHNTALPISEMNRSKVRLEIVRLLVQCFPELHPEEKEQGIHFACKLLVSKACGVSTLPEESPLCEQVLALSRLDVLPDVRDRARLESAILRQSIGLYHYLEALDEPPASLQRKLTLDDCRQFYLRKKAAPSSLPIEEEHHQAFRFGTLSSLVNHRARAYMPLPEWATENSSNSLREPPKVKDTANQKSNGSESWNGVSQGNGKKQGQFYDNSSGSSSSNSSSDSDESSSSSDESDNENDRSGGGRVADLIQMGSSGPQQRQIMPSNARRNGAPGAKSHQQAIRAKDVSGNGSDSDSSSSESSSDDDSDSSNDINTGRLIPTASTPAANHTTGILIPMGGTNDPFSNGTPTGSTDQYVSSIADDLKLLTFTPSQGPDIGQSEERDSSAWTVLVRPEHANGLAVESRYLRGPAKLKEVDMLGLSDGPSLVCLQVRFRNTKDAGSCRSLRMLQKSSTTSSSVIGPRRVMLPPEISELKAGKEVNVMVNIQFAGISDRDEALQVKLDFSSSTGSIPVVIKPRLGDLLQPSSVVSIKEFDKAFARLQGFQRIESKLAADQDLQSAAESILGSLAVTALGRDPDVLRFVGKLPASADPVFIQLSNGKIIVCCDHAMAANSIMNQVKQALAK
jgi:AP-3 complex subunit beta